MTGAAAPVGAALVQFLASRPDLTVTAVDVERPYGSSADTRWQLGDVREPTFAREVCGADVVVHAEVVTRASGRVGRTLRPVLRGAQALLTAAAGTATRRVVLLSSAQVYGASPDHPVPLPEDFPLMALPDDMLIDELLEIESLAERAGVVRSGPGVTVLRPAVLVGPGIDTLLHRYFDAPRLLVPRDGRPCWQFCHIDDLATAALAAVEHAMDGALTVASTGWLETTDVERITGSRRLELPTGLAFATAERLHRLGVTSAPASELAYTLHPWVVGSARLHEAGWAPAWDNEGALQALLSEERTRPHRRRDATLGAAGATVAVIGTAALVRAARRRRG